MHMHMHMHTHAHKRTQYAHTHTQNTIHNTQIQDTQMHNNTLANIYINTEYRTQIQQYAHTMQHTEDNTENSTQVQQRTEHNLNAHTQHNLVHIVLIFIITHIYQKTL